MQINIGLPAWVIQDGNYPEFKLGKEYRFALEFFPRIILSEAATGKSHLAHREGSDYDIEGAVVFADDECWVIDFGIPAYQEGKPPSWARNGVPICGRIYLGVDSFEYFERLSKKKGIPDLFRQWSLRKILLETTPWLDTKDARGRTIRTRDETRRSYSEVPATDSWHHDQGNGHYTFECEERNG